MDALETKTRQTLQSIRDAGAAGLYASVKSLSAFVASGQVLQNAAMTDAKGNVASKLTINGLDYLNSPEGTDPATITSSKTDLAPDAALDAGTAAGQPKAGVATVTGGTGVSFSRVLMSLPKINNALSRKSQYPLAQLAAPVPVLNTDGTPVMVDGQPAMNYDSFFLPPTAKHPDASKAFSAVASAGNKRFKKETPPREFTSRVMDGEPFGQKGVIGVGVFRIK